MSSILVGDLDVGLRKVRLLIMWLSTSCVYLVHDIDLVEGFSVCCLGIVSKDVSNCAILTH